jgi:hypothetical protein
MPPNTALVSDVCAAALRAFYNAPQRERWAADDACGGTGRFMHDFEKAPGCFVSAR